MNQESNRGERSGKIKKVASKALGERLDAGEEGWHFSGFLVIENRILFAG